VNGQIGLHMENVPRAVVKDGRIEPDLVIAQVMDMGEKLVRVQLQKKDIAMIPPVVLLLLQEHQVSSPTLPLHVYHKDRMSRLPGVEIIASTTLPTVLPPTVSAQEVGSNLWCPLLRLKSEDPLL